MVNVSVTVPAVRSAALGVYTAFRVVPLLLVSVLPDAQRSTLTFAVSLVVLMTLGAVGGRLGWCWS